MGKGSPCHGCGDTRSGHRWDDDGLCTNCYTLRNWGQSDGTCVIPTCVKPAKRSGLCGAHYFRLVNDGDVNESKPLRPTSSRGGGEGGTCDAEGCPEISAHNTSLSGTRQRLCRLHYERLRTGMNNPGGPRRKNKPGEGTIDYQGYRSFYLPDHPLAATNGKIMEHRAVLYDKVGPGPQSCHWCDQIVVWASKWGFHKGRPDDALCVDHLDHNRLNNDPRNLVASCNRCNVLRAKRHGNKFVPTMQEDN